MLTQIAARRCNRAREAVWALRGLEPKTFAVLGNHDLWRGGAEVARELERVGVTVLDNQVAPCAGVAVGGVADLWAGKPDMARVRQGWAADPGRFPLLLSHNPDMFLREPGVPLTLAGHSHCGQVVLPLIGPVVTATAGGRRYACGLVSEGGRALVVTAGIGTSMLPLRWNAPPDMWLLTLGPKRR